MKNIDIHRLIQLKSRLDGKFDYLCTQISGQDDHLVDLVEDLSEDVSTLLSRSVKKENDGNDSFSYDIDNNTTLGELKSLWKAAKSGRNVYASECLSDFYCMDEVFRNIVYAQDFSHRALELIKSELKKDLAPDVVERYEQIRKHLGCWEDDKNSGN